MNTIYLLILLSFNINEGDATVTDYRSVAIATYTTLEQCQENRDAVNMDKLIDSADVVGATCTPYLMAE